MKPALQQILLNSPSFSLDSFMANQSDGLYFDFTKTDRLFTADVGPTNVANIGDTIGLALDQRTWKGQTFSQVLAGASELINPANWQMSAAGSSVATNSPPGTLTLSPDGANASIGDISFATVVGKVYCLTSTVSANSVRLNVGTSQGGTQLINGLIIVGTSQPIFFTATATTSWLRFNKTSTGTTTITNISCKLVSPYAATQSTSSLRPTYQTTGCKFDGADDNLLTGYVAGSGANFIVARVTVPGTISAAQVFCGANDSGPANRFFIGFNTDGTLAGAVGTQSVTTIKGTSDRRGTEVAVGITINGSTVRLLDDNVIGYEAAQSGNPTTAMPFRIGALNANGVASPFFGGSIKKLVAGRQFLDLPTYLKIRNSLLNS